MHCSTAAWHRLHILAGIRGRRKPTKFDMLIRETSKRAATIPAATRAGDWCQSGQPELVRTLHKLARGGPEKIPQARTTARIEVSSETCIGRRLLFWMSSLRYSGDLPLQLHHWLHGDRGRDGFRIASDPEVQFTEKSSGLWLGCDTAAKKSLGLMHTRAGHFAERRRKHCRPG